MQVRVGMHTTVSSNPAEMRLFPSRTVDRDFFCFFGKYLKRSNPPLPEGSSDQVINLSNLALMALIWSQHSRMSTVRS